MGPFTGWSWLMAALVPAFIALTILIYNILDRLDAMYLSFSSFASKLISILFEYLCLKGVPFTLTNFMIEMVFPSSFYFDPNLGVNSRQGGHITYHCHFPL
jgi:hypothetical protein